MMEKTNFGAAIHLASINAMSKNEDAYKSASKYYYHALKLDPDSISANYGLGKLLQVIKTSTKDASIPHF